MFRLTLSDIPISPLFVKISRSFLINSLVDLIVVSLCRACVRTMSLLGFVFNLSISPLYVRDHFVSPASLFFGVFHVCPVFDTFCRSPRNNRPGIFHDLARRTVLCVAFSSSTLRLCVCFLMLS